VTNAELRRLFRQYNRDYFSGKLPNADIRFATMDRENDLGFCLLFAGVPEIRINKRLKRWPKLVRSTLLHEMVHIALPRHVQHGPRFNRELARLISEGAYDGLL